MDNNQNNEVDFESMTDDHEKITRIKEYIQRELPRTNNNDLSINQQILNKLETIYSNIEGELIEDGINRHEWLDNDRYQEILEYKDFIEAKLGEQPQQGGRKSRKSKRKSKRKSRKSKRKSRKSKKSRRKSKRKTKRK